MTQTFKSMFFSLIVMLSSSVLDLKAEDSKLAQNLNSDNKVSVASAKNEPIKIAYVDPGRVLQEDEETKDKAEKVQNEVKARYQKIEGMELSKQKKEDELKGMASLGNEQALKNKRKEIATLDSDIKEEKEDFNRYGQAAYQKVQMEALQSIEKAVAQVAKQNSIDMVLAGGVIYINDAKKIDITEDVIQFRKNDHAQKKKAQKAAAAKTEPVEDKTPVKKPKIQ